MGFADCYTSRKQPIISFELFPPKDDKAVEHLRKELPKLIDLGPNFMTVTYGAMGSTQQRTLETAATILAEYRLETACHLTCVGASRAELDNILTEIHDRGIRNIVALRGDPPKGETTFVPAADGCAHANELVAHIRDFEKRTGFERFGLAVGGYPETHAEATSPQDDLRNLKRKVDAGGDAVITQLFYDNEFFFRFEQAARRIGITVPIIPGLLPVLSLKQAMRMTSMCGATVPDGLRAELEAAGDDAVRSAEIGARHCAEQARELIDHGCPGIHFYVLNRSSQMSRIMPKLR